MLRSTHAWLSYDKGGHVQKIVYGFKYYGYGELAEQMGLLAGRWLLAEHPDMCRSLDLIIPIPLHRRKERKRGYNQSELIARGMAKVLCRPVCRDAIVRQVYTPSLTHKDFADRYDSFRGSFCVVKPQLLSNRRILLVDDVFTSGTTVSHCLEALKAVQGVEVHSFALAAP